MDLNKIKQVVDLMKKSDLSEFEIQDQEFKLRIKRDVGGRTASAPVAADPNVKVITSPMVGTFYATPSPESPNFVAIGSNVKADSVVCIIEAMKVMNEIQSELSGTIVECLVASGTSVEFGQPLFRVKVG